MAVSCQPINTPMTNKSLRLTQSAYLIFAERAANEPTKSMINKGEQQSAFIAGGSSGDFYQNKAFLSRH
jgi:hypothetical protein